MKEKIKKVILNLGADICGFANIDRFVDAPAGFHPKDIYKECKSVIVFAKALPRGITKTNPRIVYKRFNDVALIELDRIAFLASTELEKRFNLNAYFIPIPSDSPYEYWEAEKLEGRGILSMKHAAVLAGIGTLGKNTLLLNREYGNMLNIGIVLTNLDLISDPLAEEVCIDSCRICLDNCPVNAMDGKTVSQLRCRNYAYIENNRGFPVIKCNNCRALCPRVFGVK